MKTKIKNTLSYSVLEGIQNSESEIVIWNRLRPMINGVKANISKTQGPMIEFFKKKLINGLMTGKIVVIMIVAFGFIANAQSKAPSHEIWNQLLKKYVSVDGKVNYKGFKEDSDKLEQYLKLLSAKKPDENKWTSNEQKTYWINAYNAYTVKLIIDNYPVKSINEVVTKMKISAKFSPWDIKFIKIENEDFTLNGIEHEKLRKAFGDARFHFALVCAAKSCPILLNEAYTPDKLEQQLEKQTKLFINDKVKNNISMNNVKISKIFEWYADDFKSSSFTVIDFINKYSLLKINSNASTSYLEYNWDLND